jgi:hypothetical protein
VPVTPGGPVLFFSDLATAPLRGNSDTSHGQTAGTDGALVTVWGKNLGTGQGSSTLTVGGVAARIYTWGPATHGADLSTRMGMQSISFQVPGSAPVGSAPIQVTVGGVPSNTLPFTTRTAGAMYYVGPNGKDSNAGSYQAPWQTWSQAAGVIIPGDVVYLLDGFKADVTTGDTGVISLNSNGTAALPLAVVAYPGAHAVAGGDACENSGHALVSNWSSALNGHTAGWVISQLHVESPSSCAQDTAVMLGDGFRFVGNFISNPLTNEGCQSGSVQCGGLPPCGDNVYVLGNELAFAQSVNAMKGTGSKQCHGFYISGDRTVDAVETNREIAWNYIHDNGTNRAINIYNESYNGVTQPRALIEGHRVHDNWIENQRGIGILMGQDITGENWVYNNILFNVGLGPLYTDTGAFYAMQLQPGSSYKPTPTNLHVHNNLVYGASFPGALTVDPNLYYAIDLFYVSIDSANQVSLDFENNLVVSTLSGIHYVNSSSSGFAGSHNLWADAGTAPAGDSAPVAGSPLFVNAGAGDFHPLAPSAARGNGVAVPEATLDFDGIPRTAGNWSVGPYQ